MLLGIQKGLAWTTAFAAVFAFYVHSVIGLPSYEVTPISAAATAVGLIGLACFGLLQLGISPTASPARQTSSFLLTLALLFAFASTVVHALIDQVLLPEWGVAGTTFGMPILIGFCAVRGELLRAVGTICVFFACVDLTFNVLDYVGVAHIVNYAGQPGTKYGLHYLGAAGSSFATGLVGFLAVSFLSNSFGTHKLAGNILRVIIIFLIIFSIYLSGTRTYLVASIISAAVLATPSNRRVPLVICGVAIASLFLYMTFNYVSGDRDNVLRSMLFMDGFEGALKQPILGSGPSYAESGSLIASYQVLHSLGVVESGFAQFAIFYGLPATLALLGASLWAQGAWRPRQTFASVVLCLLTAILAFTTPIGSFLGSITFYTALIYCQRDELREAQST